MISFYIKIKKIEKYKTSDYYRICLLFHLPPILSNRIEYEKYKTSDNYRILKLLGLVALLGCVIYAIRVLVLGDLTLEGVLFLPFLIGIDLKLSQVNSRLSLLEKEFFLKVILKHFIS
jgi:hypothetical protein